MKSYLITYSVGARYAKTRMYCCATYISATLKDAKTQFKSEHQDEYSYIEKIEIL